MPTVHLPIHHQASGAVQAGGRAWLAGVVVAVLFLLPATVLILNRLERGAQLGDEADYHAPTIRQFAAEWPALNFVQAPAAMVPGYHVALTPLWRAGWSVVELRLVTAGVTAGMLATLAVAAARRVGTVDAVLLCAPVAASPYVFTSGIYLVPHNLSWWIVLFGVLLATLRCPSARYYLAGGLVVLLAVLTRQVHVWLAAPLAAAAWIGCGPGNDLDYAGRRDERWKRLVWLLLACLPALAVLAWFVAKWGGLAPKTQASVRPVAGINPATLTMMLVTFAFLAPAYAVTWRGGAVSRRWGIYGVAAGLAIAAVGPTSFDMDAGRWGGLWKLAQIAPTIGQRSPVIVAMAALGGGLLGMLLANLPDRRRLVMAAALAGFAAAHAISNQAWQRYYEPMALMVLVLGTAEIVSRQNPSPTRRRRVLLVGLTIVQGVITAVALR
jgi:hypothetical protein